jgi:HSP20 family molecular chaperone IbpA
VPEELKDPEGVRYFKRRLKRKSFSDQRYYVPSDKFDQEKVKAVYRNGMLTVTIPPRDVQPQPEGVKIDIVNDDPDTKKEKK